MTDMKKIAVVGAAIVFTVGGWFFAKHQAGIVARDKIDGFLIRNGLRDTVSYGDLSASPFGSATLSGVKITVPPGAAITIDKLDLADIEIKNDQVHAITIAAHDAKVPLLAIAREQRRVDAMVRDLVGMGYTTIEGDASLSMNYNDQKGTLSVESAGEAEDMGSWEAKLALGGINAASVNALQSAAQAPASMKGMAFLAVAETGLQWLAALTLAEARLTVDNSGIFKRYEKVTDKPLPSDEAVAASHPSLMNETALVMAGMPPSEATAARMAVDTWINKGGALRIATNLTQPMPLFRSGNLFSPAFDDFEGYMAATKSKITN